MVKLIIFHYSHHLSFRLWLYWYCEGKSIQLLQDVNYVRGTHVSRVVCKINVPNHHKFWCGNIPITIAFWSITNVKWFVGQEGTDWGEFIFFSVWSCLVFHLVIEEEEETRLRAKVLVLEPLGLLYIPI